MFLRSMNASLTWAHNACLDMINIQSHAASRAKIQHAINATGAVVKAANSLDKPNNDAGPSRIGKPIREIIVRVDGNVYVIFFCKKPGKEIRILNIKQQA